MTLNWTLLASGITDGRETVHPDELAFRDALEAFAANGQWSEFHHCRLLFADWLEERDRPEAVACRHVWQGERSERYSGAWLYVVPEVPGVLERLRAIDLGDVYVSVNLSQTYNAEWLLHFGPGSLRYCGCWKGHYRFSWVKGRRVGDRKPDTEVYPPRGYLGLFEKGQGKRTV